MYVDLIQRPTEVSPVTYLYLIIFWMAKSLRKVRAFTITAISVSLPLLKQDPMYVGGMYACVYSPRTFFFLSPTPSRGRSRDHRVSGGRQINPHGEAQTVGKHSSASRSNVRSEQCSVGAVLVVAWVHLTRFVALEISFTVP